MMRANTALENVVIFAGSGLNSRKIAEDIAKILNVRYSELQTKVFPDSEIYVKVPVEDVAGKYVLYVQSTAPKKEAKGRIPQSQSLMELFLTLDTFKEKKAKIVDVIVPYFAHARQDKEFQKGEIVSTRTIAKILRNLGVNQLFTVDVHSYRETGPFFFGHTSNFEGVRGYNITAARSLARYIKDKLKMESPVVIIPDEGHRPIAEKIEGSVPV